MPRPQWPWNRNPCNDGARRTDGNAAVAAIVCEAAARVDRKFAATPYRIKGI